MKAFTHSYGQSTWSTRNAALSVFSLLDVLLCWVPWRTVAHQNWTSYLDNWSGFKQLRLLHGRVRDSTTVVNSLSPQMSELVEDAIASWCGDIVGHFWLVRNGVELKFEFFSFNIFDVSDILAMSCTTEAQIQLFHSLEGIVLGFCLLDTK